VNNGGERNGRLILKKKKLGLSTLLPSGFIMGYKAASLSSLRIVPSSQPFCSQFVKSACATFSPAAFFLNFGGV
jgi:hypothetical protein